MASVSERLDLLIRDLEVDRILSSGQLERHYGLALSDLETSKVNLIEAFLAPSHGSNSYERVMFVGLASKDRRLAGASLRHLAGVAELRRIVGAATTDWESLAAARYQPHTPDALWRTDIGVLAVEYDAGSYSSSQIERKVKCFKRYAGQVWGTPSRQHARHIGHLLKSLDRRAVVLFTPWH